MRILLVDLPVHIPTVMPYSITMMKSVLSSCLDEEIITLDLNAEFHFKEYKEYYKRKQTEDYFKVLEDFVHQTRHDYSKISKSAINHLLPEAHNELMKIILSKKPDIVAFSLAYNSQLFFASGIIDELTKKNIKVIVGGPADNTKIKNKVEILQDYDSFIKFLVEKGAKQKTSMQESYLDFSDYDKEKYLTKDIVYPVRTAHSCPYKLCAFCTHHGNKKYTTIDLDFIKRSIKKNNMKKVFFIDDSFTRQRLTEIIDLMKNFSAEYWMQIRPEKNVISILPDLYSSGLRSVGWGIESGSQRMLDYMNKGTKIEDVKEVLKVSHELGIKNIANIMFGFSTETEQEFMETIKFLDDNKKYLDLISPTVFGLQKGSKAFEFPDKYGIKDISFQKRTILDEKVSFKPVSGLTQEEVKKLKKTNLAKIYSINKVPKIINACKDQILNL